jgi:pimeloyl-ACP methyl ester carboxylesterase
MGALRRRLVIWLAAIAAAYVLFVLLLAWRQDALVFPGAGRGDRGLGDVPGAVPGTLPRQDGGRFRIATVPSAGQPRAVALYFAGNGEDLWSSAQGAAELAAYGVEAIGVEHPGYGTSDGPTTVATVLAGADAAAAHGRARANELGVPLVAVGSSLGTFCAVHLAAEGRVDRLLLRSPPTTLAAAAQARFFWVPVSLFLRHRFDNLAAAPRVRCPALVLHGDRDDVVPAAHGRELCAALAGPKEFVLAAGYGHNDLRLDRHGPFGERIAAFLQAR